jgi:hypothetical protein
VAKAVRYSGESTSGPDGGPGVLSVNRGGEGFSMQYIALSLMVSPRSCVEMSGMRTSRFCRTAVP